MAFALSIFAPPLGLLYAGRWAAALLMGVLALSLELALSLRLLELPYDRLNTQLPFLLALGAALWAFSAAKQAPQGVRPWYARWPGLPGLCALAIIVFAGCRIFLYQPFPVASRAMEPTFQPGSRILAQKFGYGHYSWYGMRFGSQAITAPIRRGDILLFESPVGIQRPIYTMRVAGLPGDRIVYRNKQLFINGQNSQLGPDGEYQSDGMVGALQRQHNRLDGTDFATLENPDKPQLQKEADNFPFREHCHYSESEIRCEIPPGHYYMLGDNRDYSNDSRYWGFVPASHIVGKFVKTLR
ncbi:signal peptidase I [Massilia sp. erpn]|uniref:signal peptidase I n=1 Tax=Massilia sp. erpn TaxID=2738142 RepID=UPI0021046189|nr:signal peptidase I [Massilia sp. erpn]UTY57038.1 signal peptidase I [Massilia sp. erpn]